MHPKANSAHECGMYVCEPPTQAMDDAGIDDGLDELLDVLHLLVLRPGMHLTSKREEIRMR